MRLGSLFSGIGGFELGLERAGCEVIWQVEVDPFCRAVLAKHWPSVQRYPDVHFVSAAQLEPVDIISGGFPCQDLSAAGRRAGLRGHRSGLWREYRRLLHEMRPRWALIENVHHTWRSWVPSVRSDLGQLGYASVPVRRGDGLATAIGGRLNPKWLEWFMGYPLGWTDGVDAPASIPSAMRSSRKRRSSSGG